MFRLISIPVVLASLGLASVGLGQPAKRTSVRPVVSWKGIVEEDTVRDKIRASVVTDEATFQNLWKALKKKDDRPDIDFERAFVVVETSTDQILSICFEVDAKGNVTEGVGQAAKLKGRGFSYFAAVFPREGIQSYKGNAIKASR
jgi:hypothetical protein